MPPLPSPAIGPGWDPIERWSEVFRWKWQEEDHISVLEARVLLAAVRRALRDRGPMLELPGHRVKPKGGTVRGPPK